MLTFWCLALGLPLLAYGLVSLIAPNFTARQLKSFPRNTYAGWVLCAMAWLFTAYELDTIGIEVFDRYLKAFPGELWILAVVLTVLTCWWMPNLLPIRGACALMMLFPAELFPAVRLYQTEGRLVPVVLAYICAITGMFGMFYPWRIRQALTWRAATPGRVRTFGVAFTGYAVALLAVALLVGGCAAKTQDQAATPAFKVADAVVAVKHFDDAGKNWSAALLVDLTNAMAKVTGHVPTVYAEGQVPADAKAVIYVGDTAAARKAGVGPGDLRRGDWRVKIEPGRAYLYGRTAMATSYAVTEFAERYLDYLFLTADGEDPFTFNPALSLMVSDVTVRPAIYNREIYHGTNPKRLGNSMPAAYIRYQRCRRAHRTDEIEGNMRESNTGPRCHSQYSYVPPSKFAKEHPEWYSMTEKGERRFIPNAQCQLCYSNMEMRKAVLEELKRRVAKDRAKYPTDYPQVYDFTQMDNTAFMCYCPECKKIIAKYNRKEGGHAEGGDAGLQLECVNWLAREITKVYPDVYLRTFAYVNTECAPKPGTIVPDEHVIIWWCDVYSYSDHMRALETPNHFNDHQAKELADWLTIAKHVQLWDYMLYLDAFPEVSPDAIKADAGFYARHNLETIFMETEYHRQPFYALNYYLMSELYIDPTKDVDALIRRYCRVYGSAATEMEAAIQYLRQVIAAQPTKGSGAWHSRILPWRTRPVMEKLVTLLDAAYRKENSPRVKSRITEVLASTWKELVRILRQDPAASEAFKMAQANYLKYASEYAKTGHVDDALRASRIAEVKDELDVLTLRFADLPAEFGTWDDATCKAGDYHLNPKYSRTADSDSSRKFASASKENEKCFEKGFPIGMGVYDYQTKESFSFPLKAWPHPEGQYVWTKLGRAHIGWNTCIWFPGSWHGQLSLRDLHLISDGVAIDPNWYDFWVSLKLQGPAFYPGSKKPNRMFLDRVALKRVPPPTKAMKK